MSLVVAMPEVLGTAATDLAGLGSTLSAAHAAAATQTTGVLAAAEDEVSAAIAAVFSTHGQGFHALSARAAAFHDQFVQALNSAGAAYAGAEAANASPLQAVVQAAQSLAVFSPVKDLTGRPLVGDGANGAPGTGQNGAPGVGGDRQGAGRVRRDRGCRGRRRHRRHRRRWRPTAPGSAALAIARRSRKNTWLN